MIVKVENKRQLFKFIYYIKELYKNSPNYTFPIFWSLKKELIRYVLKLKMYYAILALDERKNIVGRLLYTFSFDERKKEKVCYFSFFDSVNNGEVAKELFAYVKQEMKKKQVCLLEGPYAPYDPDTRRGVLIEGFDLDHTLFHSYNYEYYDKLLINIGFSKKIDTLALNAKISNETMRKLTKFSHIFYHNNDVEIKSVNFKHIDQDIEDVCKILKSATDEKNYQDAPSKEMIIQAFKSMKLFLKEEYIKIARDAKTKEPLGFCLVMLDYNQILKKTKGKIRLFEFLYAKKSINKTIGKLQYVIPRYQKTGLISAIFYEIYQEMIRNKITEFEAGTILEDNERSYSMFYHFGGRVIKRFRIYQMEI